MLESHKEEKMPDLSCLDTVSASEAGAEIELRHPVTGAGLNVFITVLGSDARAVIDYKREKGDEYLRKMAVAKQRNKNDDIQTMTKLEASQIEFLTVCTIGWRWGARSGVFPFQKAGHPIEELAFNVQNVKRVYTELPAARQQIDEAIGDAANFIKA